MGEGFAIDSMANLNVALQVANEAKNLMDPEVSPMDNSLARKTTMSGGIVNRANPNLSAMQKTGGGVETPRFTFVPFQDWFSSPYRRR
jgi:hypothetical protein